MVDSGRCETLHTRLGCIELVTLLQIRTVEASMHGLFRKSGEIANHIYRRWGIGVFALPVLLAITLVGMAITPRVAPNWMSQAAESEFTGANYRPEAAPAQPERPAIEIRTVKAN
jgi:hypothetical protein